MDTVRVNIIFRSCPGISWEVLSPVMCLMLYWEESLNTQAKYKRQDLKAAFINTFQTVNKLSYCRFVHFIYAIFYGKYCPNMKSCLIGWTQKFWIWKIITITPYRRLHINLKQNGDIQVYKLLYFIFYFFSNCCFVFLREC